MPTPTKIPKEHAAVVHHWVEQLYDVIAQPGDGAQVQRCWTRILAYFLRQGRPFRKATADLLMELVPETVRMEWVLSPLPDLDDL